MPIPALVPFRERDMSQSTLCVLMQIAFTVLVEYRHNVGSPRLEEELGRVGIHQRVSRAGVTTTTPLWHWTGCSLKTGCSGIH